MYIDIRAVRRDVVTPHGCVAQRGAAYMRTSLLSPAAHDIADVVGVRRRCIPRHLNFVLDRARPRQRCPSAVSALVFRRDRPGRPAVHATASRRRSTAVN